MKSRILVLFILLIGYVACLVSMVFMTSESFAVDSSSLLPLLRAPGSSSAGFNLIYEPLVAAVSGGILTSGVFFFFLKRMLDQYDKRHEKNERNIEELCDNFNELELSVSEKLHQKSNDLHESLTDSTRAIIDTLDSLRDTIQDLVEDLAVLKTEHSKCDYNSGDVKLLKNQIDNINNLCKRLEKQISKHI